MHRPALILLLGVLLVSGCTGGSRTVQNLTSYDPSHDHWAIASYYSRQAAMSRQQAEEITSRVATYERLFGRESDWVTGTRTGPARRSASGTKQGSVAPSAYTITRH